MKYLTTREVAELIQMSEEYVARQCSAGFLPAKKLGTEWRIEIDDLTRFMSGDQPAKTDRPGRPGQSARQKRRAS